MGAQFTIPLITVIPGQLIASALWNNEFNNINTNFIPAGMDSYSDTDAQMQIQTAPYPGSVTSHASNLGGEIERIRFQIAAILGNTYWYQAPAASLATAVSSLIPVGGVIDYPSVTAPNANFHLADGTAIDRVIYASLFTLIGTTFGIGDGTTSFNLPNYTDKMSIAAGNLYALAATGGSPTHTLLQTELPTALGTITVTDPGHTHTATDSGHSHGITDPGHTHIQKVNANATTSGQNRTQINTNGTAEQNSVTPTASATTGASINSGTANVTNAVNTTGISATIANGTGGNAHNILNPYLAMYKMIRVL